MVDPFGLKEDWFDRWYVKNPYIKVVPFVGAVHDYTTALSGWDPISKQSLGAGERFAVAVDGTCNVVLSMCAYQELRAMWLAADAYYFGGRAAQAAANTPSINTKVINAPEVKAPNAINSSQVTQRWDDYLGENTTNINSRTGLVDPNRIFSADGTKSVRFDNHEMNSMGTTKSHYHQETWTYDSANDTMTVTNTLQRIK